MVVAVGVTVFVCAVGVLPADQLYVVLHSAFVTFAVNVTLGFAEGVVGVMLTVSGGSGLFSMSDKLLI